MDRQTSDVAIVAIAGVVTAAAGEPVLVTGSTYRTYPEEAILPLRWIGQRLAAIHRAKREAHIPHAGVTPELRD